MIPLREIEFGDISKIQFHEVPSTKLKHFQEAIRFVRPTVNKKALCKFNEWN
jgi:hypothetical protein